MAEEEQVITKEPQQVTKEPRQVQQVTTKNTKKVEAGKRMAAHNCRRREEQVQSEKSRANQSYGIGAGFSHAFGAILAVGVIGGLGYYIY